MVYNFSEDLSFIILLFNKWDYFGLFMVASSVL